MLTLRWEQKTAWNILEAVWWAELFASCLYFWSKDQDQRVRHCRVSGGTPYYFGIGVDSAECLPDKL